MTFGEWLEFLWTGRRSQSAPAADVCAVLDIETPPNVSFAMTYGDRENGPAARFLAAPFNGELFIADFGVIESDITYDAIYLRIDRRVAMTPCSPRLVKKGERLYLTFQLGHAFASPQIRSSGPP